MSYQKKVKSLSMGLQANCQAALVALHAQIKPRKFSELKTYLGKAAGLDSASAEAVIEQLLDERVLVEDAAGKAALSPRRMWLSGTVVGVRSGNYLFEPDDSDQTATLLGSDQVPVLPGDRVWVAEQGYDPDSRYRAVTLQALIARRSNRIVCQYSSRSCLDEMICVRPVDPFSQTTIYVKEPDIKGTKLNSQAFVVELAGSGEQISLWGANQLVGQIVEVLGSLDDADVEIDVALHRFELPHQFTQAAMEQARALPQTVDASQCGERVDLRDIAFVTIDGEDAKDFDDAVWAQKTEQGWRLLVAIADVSYYVTDQSALDRDAQERATSVYFPRRVIPMLPELLSNGLCSLNPGVDRCTLVCDMTVDAQGIVTAYQFYPALIHSHARLTYTMVWDAHEGRAQALCEHGGSLGDILTLFDLYQAFRQARKQRGAIDFETTETQIVCDPVDGRIAGITRREHNDAHRLIEECMLAANTCAADFIVRKKVTSLFRTHPCPSPDRLAALRATLSAFRLKLGGGDNPSAQDFEKVVEACEGKPWTEIVQLAMLRSMQQAVYSPDNEGHYGLNYPAYTHFTSPIRRYPDLLVHRTIRTLVLSPRRKYVPHLLIDPTQLMATRAGRVLEKKSSQNSRTQPGADTAETSVSTAQSRAYTVWSQLGNVCSAAERRADEASRDVTAWLKCTYMKNLLGESFEGTITGINTAGLYVTLDTLFVDGFVHISRIGNEYFSFDEKTNCLSGESTGQRYRIGDKLRVRVTDVDVDGRRIDFTSTAFREKARIRQQLFYNNFDEEFDEDFDEDFEAKLPQSTPNDGAKKNGKTTGARKKSYKMRHH